MRADVVEVDGVPVGVHVIAYHPQSGWVAPNQRLAGPRRSAVTWVIIHHRFSLPGCQLTLEIGDRVTADPTAMTVTAGR